MPAWPFFEASANKVEACVLNKSLSWEQWPQDRAVSTRAASPSATAALSSLITSKVRWPVVALARMYRDVVNCNSHKWFS